MRRLLASPNSDASGRRSSRSGATARMTSLANLTAHHATPGREKEKEIKYIYDYIVLLHRVAFSDSVTVTEEVLTQSY